VTTQATSSSENFEPISKDASPDSRLDPLAYVEQPFAEWARKLADATVWLPLIEETWPTPIAATYALLRATLRNGQIDASALIFKDLFELLARFSALTLACDILQHGSDDKQTEVTNSLFSNPLAMGDWVSLADQWSKWLESASQRDVEWITRPIARMWRNGRNRTRMCELIAETLVAWRNQTIGHGVRGDDLDLTMEQLEKFLGEGQESLNEALAEFADLGNTLELVDAQGRALRGAQAQHDQAAMQDIKHTLGALHALYLRKVTDQGTDQALSLRSLMAVRRCEVCGQAETFHFDSAKAKKFLPDFRVLNYERGHALHVPGSVDVGMLQDWRRMDAPVAADAAVDFDNDAALPADVVSMLDEQSIELGYRSPTYLRKPLAEFIERQLEAEQGGLYWLRAPAHVGKSTFVQGLEPRLARKFRESDLVDDLAVVVYTIRREYQFHLAQFADSLRAQLQSVLNLASNQKKLPELNTDAPSPEAFVKFLADFQRLGRKPLLVVIDGLDELPELHPGILDVLPTHASMPPEVFLLLTSRPLADCAPWMQPRLQSFCAEPGREVGLQDADYTVLLKDYAQNRLRDKLKQKGAPALDTETLHTKLLERSDARFLYYRFLADRLAEGDIKTGDLDALTQSDHLLPQFVQALLTRYAGMPMGERIERTLASLALAEDAFNRQNQAMPASAQSLWQGLAMPVLCDLIESTPGMTPAIASTLYLLKPLLGTWRGDDAAPRYRLGLKGLDDILRQRNTLAELAGRWVDQLTQRHTQWLQTPEDQRESAESYRGVGLDWTLRHLDGVLPLLSQEQHLSLRKEAALLQNLWLEMLSRGMAAKKKSRLHDALNMYTVVQALLRLASGREVPDTELWDEPDGRAALDGWLELLNERGLTLGDLGDTAAAIADFAQSICLSQALRSQLGDQFPPDMAVNLAVAYVNRGNALRGQGDTAAAFDDYTQANSYLVALRNQLGDQFPQGMAHILASVYTSRGAALSGLHDIAAALADHAQAISLLDTLRIQLSTQFPPDMALSLAGTYMNRGISLDNQGETAAALADFEQAISVFEALRRQLGSQFLPDMASSLASVYLSRGNALRGLGDSAAALADFEQAISVFEALRRQLGSQFPPDMANRLAAAYMSRGVALSDQGDAAAALADFEQAISLRESLRRQLASQFPPAMASSLAEVYLNRGSALRSLGGTAAAISAIADYTEAISLHETLRRKLGTQFPPDMALSLAAVYLNRGLALSGLGDTAAALADYEQAISIVETLRRQFGTQFPPAMADSLARAYASRGNALHGLGDSAAALADFEQAISVFEALRRQLGTLFPPDMANSLATVYMNRGSLRGLGDTAAALADYAQAISLRETLRRQLGAQFPPAMADNLAKVYMNRGNALSVQGDTAAALSDYTQAISLCETLRWQLGAQFPPAMANNLATAYKNRAEILHDLLGDTDATLNDLRQAVGLWNELESRLGENMPPAWRERRLAVEAAIKQLGG